MTGIDGNLTLLLESWSQGDGEALNELMRLVYPSLRQIAFDELQREQRQHRRNKPHTLMPTELINITFLKLIEQQRVTWEGHKHFFAVAAMMMRRILTDHARARLTDKRGQGFTLFSLDDESGGTEIAIERAAELIALDDALTSLGKLDPRKVRIVEMRFYGGWTYDEIGEYLQVQPESIRNQWRFAKLWLLREITGADAQLAHSNSTNHHGVPTDAITANPADYPDPMAED